MEKHQSGAVQVEASMPSPLPVQPLFYDTGDIQIIMGCCGDEARTIARRFFMQGQAIRIGRKFKVPRPIFDGWVRAQCGLDQYYKVPFKVIEGGKQGGTS